MACTPAASCRVRDGVPSAIWSAKRPDGLAEDPVDDHRQDHDQERSSRARPAGSRAVQARNSLPLVASSTCWHTHEGRPHTSRRAAAGSSGSVCMGHHRLPRFDPVPPRADARGSGALCNGVLETRTPLQANWRWPARTSRRAARRAGRRPATTPATAPSDQHEHQPARRAGRRRRGQVAAGLRHRPAEEHAEADAADGAEGGDHRRLPPHHRPQLRPRPGRRPAAGRAPGSARGWPATSCWRCPAGR